MVHDQLLDPRESDGRKAASIAFGIFMGIIPIWGFQLIAAIFLAILFRLNKALVILAANISIPPIIPLIVFLSFKAGAYWMENDVVRIDFTNKLTIASAANNLKQYLYGSITLAVISAVIFGALSFILLKIFKRKRNPDT